MKTINLLQTKNHLHPRQPHTRLCFRGGRAGVQQFISAGDFSSAQTLNNSISTTLLPEINQKQYNNIVINHYLRMQSTAGH